MTEPKDFRDLSAHTLTELEARLTEASSEIDRWGMCDNLSDIGCCDRCGLWALREEIELRHQWAGSRS